MFLKQLNNLIQHVSLASRIEVQDRRHGNDRRQVADRRQEVRFGDCPERRSNTERRQQPPAPAEKH